MSDEKAVAIRSEARVAAGGQVKALIPTNIEGFYRLAQYMNEGEFLPKSYANAKNKTAAAFSAMVLGAEVGLTPFAAVQNIAVINGKPSIYGDAMLAIVRASGELEYIKESIEGTGDLMKAVCEIKRVSEIIPAVEEFSVEDAKTAGLWKKSGPWSTYPKRMLKFRARGFALRDNFGDLLSGMITREEAEDLVETAPGEYATRKDINAAIETATVSAEKEVADPPMVDKAEEAEVVHAWDKSNWAGLRQTGITQFAKDHAGSFVDATPEQKYEFEQKWKRVVRGVPFPFLTETEDTQVEDVPGESDGEDSTTTVSNQGNSESSSESGSITADEIVEKICEFTEQTDLIAYRAKIDGMIETFSDKEKGMVLDYYQIQMDKMTEGGA